jgi:hypothetical protein
MLIAVLLIFQFTSNILPASAAPTLLYGNDNGTYGSWNQGANDLFIYKMTAPAGVAVSSVKVGFASGVTTGAPITTVYFFADNAGNVGSILSTFSYSSNDGTRFGTYTGSFNVPVSGTFWIAMQASAYIYNAGNGVANNAGTTWSLNISTRFYGTSVSGPFSSQGTASSPVWLLYGSALTALSTPAAPNVASSSSTVTVTETATTTNASSYLIKIFQSDGLTLIDSKTATASSILTGTTFTGLSPNTVYKVGVIAIGDGVTYETSTISTLTSLRTALGSTSAALQIVGAPTSVVYRTSYQLRLTATGSNGTVAFKANQKPIPGCQKVATSAYIANCSWKPSMRGTNKISALFTPSSQDFLPSSALIQLQVDNRSGRR